MRRAVLILVGPTASGKSAVAYELAQRLSGEIISADSMQVYRRVPLLTQQPQRTWQERIPHHLIGTLDLSEPWSAADFRRHALQLIDDILARSRAPLIVGGTGLYVRALLDGLCAAPAAQPRVRQQLTADIAAQGSAAVHQRLAAVDPVAAQKIHPRDARRIVRALEVYAATGTPLSQHWARQPHDTFPHPYQLIGLAMPREALYARINARVARMFEEGVVDEARALDGERLSHTAGQMLGLPAIREHAAGRITRERAVELVQQQTRQYARRQLIWFRKEPRLRWVSAEGAPADVAARVLECAAS